MSAATERTDAKSVLARHCLMTTGEVAEFLGTTPEQVGKLIKAGKIPAANRTDSTGRTYYGVDPMDAVVYVLAEREGITAGEYWEAHGDEAADHARRYVERVRRFVA